MMKLRGILNLRGVSYQMDCKYCKGSCVKAGFQKTGKQKFYCKRCSKYQQATYSSEAYWPSSTQQIVNLLCEGVGLRSMTRVLGISMKTIIHRIKQIAKSIRKPLQYVKGRVYELDELWTYIGKKTRDTWIMYVLDRSTKLVIDFRVGSRTKENLQALTSGVLHLHPLRMCTDRLVTYRSLIPDDLHTVKFMSTRHIERNNLNLRMHLKRLSRKTICFSKSGEMLEACLRIYFWRTSEHKSFRGRETFSVL